MMLKILLATMASLFFVPFFATAAASNVTTKQLTVTGEVYKTCTVTVPGDTFHLGRFRSTRWDVGGGDGLEPEQHQFYIVRLEQCDPSTTVTITAQANSVSTTDVRFIANEGGNNPEIQGSLALQNHNSIPNENDGKAWRWLWMDGTHPIVYTTVAAAGDTHELKFWGLLRRTNTAVSPVGTFSGGLTLTFTFS